MPSPRPVKPSFSLVVAFTPTRSIATPGDLGDARAHRVAMRADPRRLAHDGDVEMRDAPAACARALDREGEEPVGRGAAPVRIARREMHADIAVGERAQDGVDQRMEHDVGVGMAGQAARMGDAHAAEHDVIAVAELVHIEADAGAHVAQGCELGRLGAGEIVLGGELHVCRLALERATFRPAHSASAASSVKSSRPAASARRCASSRAAKPKACGVCTRRRWRAVDRAGHEAAGIDRLDRVGDRNDRDRRAGSSRRRRSRA